MLLTLLVVLSVPVFAFADSEITVNGTGEVLIPADTAVVSLGVSATDREVLEAQEQANQAIADIREASDLIIDVVGTPKDTVRAIVRALYKR